MSENSQAVVAPVEASVMPCGARRAVFEVWAKENRPDLDLRYMYDAQGNYCHDGYIWADTANAFGIWEAAIAAERERCAKICEAHAAGWDATPGNNLKAGYIAASNCAFDIRRPNTKMTGA